YGNRHRDSEPSIILIRTDASAVPAAVCMAKMAGALRTLSGAGAVMATQEYMSPEHAADEPIGPASDLYSFAVVAYEMLTGRVPFGADTPAAVRLSHVTKPMPSTRAPLGQVSAPSQEVLRGSLAKRPEDGFQTAAVVVAA